jgi:itaconate CoA-transferase
VTAGARDRPLPLDGLLVVSIEQAVAAPFAARQLADLGARVVKVERPDGGDFARSWDEVVRGMSAYFAWLNRGKESVTADLKEAEDRELVESLVAQADVYIQNLAPGAAERLDLGAAQLVGRYPRLVACDLSGYGAGGPYGAKKAYDLLIQCEAGLVSATGTGSDPAKVGISIADIAGGMYAFSGILTALYERERTGEGSAFEVSLFDALAEWMSHPAYYGHYRGEDLRRSGTSHASIAPYGPFPTAGGSEVNLAIQNEREWRTFCEQIVEREELLEDERFTGNANRVANREALEAIVAEALADLELDELVRRLEQTRLAYGLMRTASELVEHPQLTARDRWRTVGSPVGDVLALLPPVTESDREPAMGDIPALGQHDQSVRSWVAERSRTNGAGRRA